MDKVSLHILSMICRLSKAQSRLGQVTAKGANVLYKKGRGGKYAQIEFEFSKWNIKDDQ